MSTRDDAPPSEPASPRSALWRNLQAGTTTAIVIIPQGMAYALVAGLPAIHGLYASLLPLIVYALVGRSRELAVGPGALDTLLVGTSLAGLAFVTEANYAGYAALLALEVALIQLILGACRAGFLVNFLSRPVLSGFTSAAALTIGFSQMRHLLGYTADKSPHFHELAWQLITHLHAANPATCVIGLACVVALVVLKRVHKPFPRALFVVVVAIVAVELLELEARGVAVLGTIPRGLPQLSAPPLEPATMLALLPTALAISFVGYLTMISIAKTFAERNNYEISANRELVAAGASNFVASLSQGFPISASFSRSAVHASSGSSSHYTLMVTAGWVGLTLMFLTDYFYSLPKATLAAIIVTAVFGLIDVAIVRRLREVKRADMWLLLITFVATLAVGIEAGILIGVGCSLALFIYRTTRPHTAVLGRVGETRDFRNIENSPEAITYPGLLILRFDAQFYFANVNFFKDLLRGLEAESEAPLSAVIIEACSLTQLDSSADAALQELAKAYEDRGIALCFASVKVPVLTVMKASGLHEQLGAEHFFMNVDEAVCACLARQRSRASDEPAA